MITVDYHHDFQYHQSLPTLQLRLQAIAGNYGAVDIDAVLDTGAALSLFSGDFGRSIGLDILAGTLKRYQTTSGFLISGYLHPVRLSHEELGDFEIEIGFSIDPISRNLLGRDFFDRIQVGFREHHSRFFVTPLP